MGWKHLAVLLVGLLILGFTASSAVATADFVSQTANMTVKLPPPLVEKQKDEVQPENAGVVAVRVLSIFIPGAREVVIVGTIASIIAGIVKYLYGKPVGDFTKAFISEIPDKQGDLIQVTKTNFWGSKAEIGYGYVKKEWGGLKKEAVIVKPVITITRSEVKAVEDLFSPKELGKLLAQAYKKGWNAKDAYEIAREFREATGNFHAEFRGLGRCEAGDVTLDPDRREHIIEHHITMEAANWRKIQNSQWNVNSGRDIANIIKEVIESFDKSASGCYENGRTAVLRKNKGGVWYRVVIKKIKGKWKVWTAFPEI